MKYEKLCHDCKAAGEKSQAPKSLGVECPKCIEKSQDEMLKIIFGESI